MLFWTHILFSLTFYQLYVFFFDPHLYSIPAILSLVGGSMFPDIDHPQSKLGKRLPYLSRPLNFLFRHRGIVHSFVGLLGCSILIYFVLSFFIENPFWLTAWFSAGFLFHLLGDGLTKEGVYLVPSLLLLKGKMKTGGFVEKILVGLLLITNGIMLAVYFGFW